MKTKIVHASDTHLGYLYSVDSSEPKTTAGMDLIKTAISKIRAEKPDVLVISGDLVKSPYVQDFNLYDVFLKQFESIPVLCVPGNCDYNHPYFYPEKNDGEKTKADFNKRAKVKVQDIEWFKDNKTLSAEEGKYYTETYIVAKSGSSYQQYLENVAQYGEYKLNLLREYTNVMGTAEPNVTVNNVNLIGVDSNRDISVTLFGKAITDQPDREIYFAALKDGELNNAHLESIAKQCKPGINITVMHHPIFFIPGANDLYGRFYEGRRVARALLEAGVQMSLSGHKHIQGHASRNIETVKGRKKFHVCSAGSLLDWEVKKPYRDNSYNVVTIDGGNVLVEYQELKSNTRKPLAKFSIEV
jgi:3',5'-cyclic AMP phosphodiesterase CpdA